jgi:hypothetical protein
VPALAENVVDVEPAAMVTEVGTVTIALLLPSVTDAPEPVAAAVSVTVHVLSPPEPRLVGLQLSEDSEAGPIRAIDVSLDTPP